MNTTYKFAWVFILGFSFSVLAEGPDPVPPEVPGAVDCEVTEIQPEHANFFAFGGVVPPVVGDRIEINLKQTQLTDLTFESGHALPIKRSGAKLQRETQSTYQSVYRGKHLGTFTRTPYEGLVIVNHGSPQGSATFQILAAGKRFGSSSPMVLHTARLECTTVSP